MIFLIAKKTRNQKIHPMQDVVGAITNPHQALAIQQDLESGDQAAHTFFGLPVVEGQQFEIYQLRDIDELILKEQQKIMRERVDNSAGKGEL